MAGNDLEERSEDQYFDPRDSNSYNPIAQQERERTGIRAALADDSIQKLEDTPSHINNFTGSNATTITKSNFKTLIKRKGALGAIIAIIVGGGLVGVSLGGPSLLLFHVAENVMSKFDSQSTSLNLRTNRIIATKLTANVTGGVCTPPIKMACRYTRPSNGLLRSLERNGIIAVDKQGNPIDIRKGPFPNQRPAGFLYTPPGQQGPPNNITAEKFYSELRRNAEFRAAFHKSYNTRFFAYSVLDKVMLSVKKRFNFNGQNKLSDVGQDNRTLNDSLKDASGGDDTGAKNAAASGDDEKKKGVVRDLLSKEAKASTDKLARSGRGNAAMLAGGAVCLLTDIPGTVSRTARAYQLSQLIPYGATIVTGIYAIKAGDGTPAMASALGTFFTQTHNGKSAMDSFGMRYALFGDTNPGNGSYKKFVPGGSVIQSLSGVQRFTDSSITKGACSTVANPVVGVGVNAALAPTVVGALANIAIGVVLSEAIALLAPPIIDAMIGILPIDDILKYFMGDLTENLVAQDRGDAFISGVSHLSGQTANARGNMALTVEQAVEYSNLTKDVQLAYAEEDRATLSPFDATSPNTMLGSFVNQFLPYYSQISTIQGVASMFIDLVPRSFSMIFQSYTAQAADSAAQFTGMCDDPAIAENNIAAGPFCNIEYGIPAEFLDKDPYQVFNELVASGDVNPNTGEIIRHSEEYVVGEDYKNAIVGEKQTLEGWLDLCADGSASLAKDCVITEETANFALYTVDKSIIDTMDAMDGTGEISAQSSLNLSEIESEITNLTTNDTASQQPSIGVAVKRYISLLSSAKSFLSDTPQQKVATNIDLSRFSLWRA